MNTQALKHVLMQLWIKAIEVVVLCGMSAIALGFLWLLMESGAIKFILQFIAGLVLMIGDWIVSVADVARNQ